MVTDSMGMNVSKLQEMVEEPGVQPSTGSQRVGHGLETEQQQQSFLVHIS